VIHLEGVICGFIDFWPGFNNKFLTQTIITSNEVIFEEPYLVVANFDYLYANFRLEPYEIWMKKAEGATISEIYKDLKAKNLSPVKLTETTSQIIEMKNDPALQATNGTLTLGFIVALIVCTIGFIIYWILSIKDRVLQFGVFRAMGLTFGKILGMLICEQILISGAAILVGIILGGVASDLFTPFLTITENTAEQILPYRIISLPQDYLKIYAFTGSLLLFGLIVIAGLVAGIKIDQSVKLGED